MSGHTPGPWVLHPKHPDYVVPLAHSGRLIGATSVPEHRSQYADVIYAMKYKHSDEDKANARLIAAAPDLLAACKAMVAYQNLVESGAETGLLTAYADAFEGAEAAIAKATGND